MKLLLAALPSLIGTALFAAEAPPVGSAAPNFSLTDTKGETCRKSTRTKVWFG